MTDPKRRIYLDYNASAPLLPEAREALIDALMLVGNPSSVHSEGRRVRALVEAARTDVAALVSASPSQVVFTSGATEAAETCLTPTWMDDGKPLELDRAAVLETDHPCVREGGQFRAENVDRILVDGDGLILRTSLEGWLNKLPAERWAMLALSWANSETGVLQPLGEIGALLNGRNVILVVDAAQMAGRLPISLAETGADALLLSGHKLGAAKGVGAFVLKSEARRPQSLLTGGGQERQRRAGTEAVPLIASFGAAARKGDARSEAERAHLRSLQSRLESRMTAHAQTPLVVGAKAPRLPNTVTLACRGIKAETAQIGLDLSGFAVSSGSACSSGRVGPSHVLRAMCDGGAEIDVAVGAVRVSFGYETTAEEIDLFADAYERLIQRASQTAQAAA